MEKLDIKQLFILEDFINGKNIFMSGLPVQEKHFSLSLSKEYVIKHIRIVKLLL